MPVASCSNSLVERRIQISGRPGPRSSGSKGQEMRYSLDFNWLWDGMGALAYGAGTTLALTATTSVLGIVLSVLGAAARRGRHPWVRKVVGLYVEIMRNTPFLVQLFFIFFG